MNNTSKFISWKKIVSYWFLWWFIIYFFASFFKEKNEIAHFIYENTNPIFLFIIGLIGNIYMLCVILYYNKNGKVLIKYLIEMLLIKIIPIYYLYYQKIKIYENILFSIIGIFIYLLYLSYNKEDVITIYYDINKSILHDEDRTPLLYYLEYYIQLLHSKLEK